MKSSNIEIQAAYQHNDTFKKTTSLHALAIGGPFLGGNTLTIRTLEGEVRWNKEVILPEVGSEFSNEFMVARYHKGAELVMNGHKGPGIDIDLPLGVTLVVNRWKKSLAVKVHMCHHEPEQDGQCGNNDLDIKDDSQAEIEMREASKVPAVLSFFPGGGKHM